MFDLLRMIRMAQNIMFVTTSNWPYEDEMLDERIKHHLSKVKENRTNTLKLYS